jgi:4-aminobutyrate aminotransferase-like enzyme
LLDGDFAERALRIEKKVKELLSAEGIVEIRGRGAMLGMELKDRDLTRRVVEACLQQGVILGWTLHSDTLVRLAPPLIIEEKLLVDTLNIIRETVEKFVNKDT